MNNNKKIGIYFLKKNNIVVYVGQSIDIETRVKTHKRCLKDFDSFDYVECKKEILNSTENYFILFYNPILNKKKFELKTFKKIVKQYNKLNKMGKEFTQALIEKSTLKEVKEIAQSKGLKIYALFAEMLKVYKEKEAQK